MRTVGAALLLTLAVAGCGKAANAPRVKSTALTVLPRRASPVTPPRASYAPWPAFAHDARHAGEAPVKGPQSGRVRWKRRLEGPVVPGPAVGADGTVYAASNGGVLHALDPATGRDRWVFDAHASYGSDLSTVPLVRADGTILWPGPHDTLYALDSRGHVTGSLGLGAQGLSPAAAPDGGVYLADTGGGLRSLNVHGGVPRVRWTVRLGSGPSYASPAVGGDGTVYGASDRTLTAVAPTGTVRWQRTVRGTIEVSPAVAPDGTVIVGANDHFVHAFSPTGKPRWAHLIRSLTYSSPVVTAGGVAVFGDHRGALSRVDARSGRLLSRVVGLAQTRARSDVGIWTAPALDDHGDVYFGTRTGHIYGFAPDGRRLFDVKTGATVDSYPALGADGTLLIGSEDGNLYAIG